MAEVRGIKELSKLEPWQMTIKEYDSYVRSLESRMVWTSGEMQAGGIATPDAIKASSEQARIKAGYPHSRHIREALSEGKPVPTEVLADYPDLKPPAVEEAPPVEAVPPAPEVLTGDIWNIMEVEEQEAFVRQAGLLSETVGKSWAELTDTEQSALRRVRIELAPPAANPEPDVDITKGVIKKGDKLVANPENIPAARAFVAELRRQADETEKKAAASTESKARSLMQNARQARKDADNIEKTIPNPPGANPGIEHRGTEPEGIAVGDELGIRYDGKTEEGWWFTDARQTGSSLLVDSLGQTRTRLADIRKPFALPPAPEVLSEEIWKAMDPEPRTAWVNQAKLTEDAVGKAWGELTSTEQATLIRTRHEITPPLSSEVDDILPMSPLEGPPLPRGLGLKWPWAK